METIKIRDLGFKELNEIKYNSITEEELLKIVFISYYGICIDNVDYFDIFNSKNNDELFKMTGIISEEKIKDILNLLYLEDEEVKKCLEVLDSNESFKKVENGYILNENKLKRNQNILKEIFIFNGYTDGVQFLDIVKQLNSSFSISLKDCLLCLYIAKFGNYLIKKDNKYYLDNNKITNKEIELMNRIVNIKRRKKGLIILNLLKEKLEELKNKKIDNNSKQMVLK